ncbi:MAG: tetratricopeptide repeat protein, partial [Actinomycetota bacterium]|nr:tetratricopeptide repeat protein [Actinomycetota bacterium]
MALNNLGAVQLQRGRVAEAQRLLRDALRLRREVLPPDDPALAETLMNLGVLAQNLRRRSLASSLFQEALAIRQAAWPDIDHPFTAQAMSSVANMEHDAGDIEGAFSMAEDALAMRRRLFAGAPHPDLAESLNNVAHMHAVGGRLHKATDLWKEAIDVLIPAVGYNAPDLATCFDNLAQASSALGELEQARPAAQTAVRIAEQALGEDHPSLPQYLSTQALVMAMSGDRAGAWDCLRRARMVEEAAYWRVVRMSSARGRAAYMGATRSLVDAMLSMVLSAETAPTSAELVEVADLVLRRKRVELETRMA